MSLSFFGSRAGLVPVPATPVYFPGLNGLRFLAALLVIVSHVEEMKRHFGYANYRSVPAIQHLGGAAVTFFFVLSGFLITYLLLEEKRKTGTVSLTTFYLKRVLRIWPLYYLIVVLGLFVLPHVPALIVPRFAEAYEHAPAVLPALFLGFLPNVALAAYGFTPYLVQTWSIGVEEQFYLIWPLVLLFARRPLRAMLAAVGVYIGVFVLVRLALTGAAYLPDALTLSLSKLQSLIKLTRLDCMAIGGVGAYLLFTGRRTLLALIRHPVTEGLAWVLENQVMGYLGKISYGLYMYHFLVIGAVLALLRNYFTGQPRWLNDLSIYALTLLLTVAVSAVSFHAFENKLIQLRPWLQRRLHKTRLVLGRRWQVPQSPA